MGGGRTGKVRPSLDTMARKDLWPTPKASSAGPDFAKLTRSKTGVSLQTAVAMKPRTRIPTPSATDYKGSAKAGQRRGQLTDPAMGVIEAGGSLSPDWVEWLMGWPIGWTSLDPLPAENFAEWQTKIDAGEWWRDDPSLKRSSGDLVPRTAPGVPNRAKRLRAIGNGQVPSCAALAWVTLCGR